MPVSIVEREGQVVENQKLTADLSILRIQLKDWTSFHPVAGQYIMFILKDQGKDVRKAYSIADYDSSTGMLEICLKKVENGKASTYLRRLRTDQKVRIIGPFGRFVLQEPLGPSIVFVAAGTGIAPINAMLRRIASGKAKKAKEPRLWLIQGSRTAQDLMYADWFREFEQGHPPFTYIPVLSREDWEGSTGHVQDILPDLLAKDKELLQAHYYICGLIPMVENTKALLLQQGVPEEQIHYEKYF